MRQEKNYCAIGWRDNNSENFMISRKSDPADDQQKAGVTEILLLIDEYFSIQNEYMCDTNKQPAQADGLGDYVVIPEVRSSTFCARITF